MTSSASDSRPGRVWGPAAVALAALVAGFAAESFLPAAAHAANWAVEKLFSAYDVVGPVILFIALSASLAGVFEETGGVRASVRVFVYLLGRKLAALVWAVAFTAVALDLPLTRERAAGMAGTLDALGRTLHASLGNRYTWAAVAAVVIGLAARRVRVRGRGLHELEVVVEELGGGLEFLAPLFLFAFGAYIRGLPGRLAASIPGLEAGAVFRAYLAASGLVFVACAIWHMALVGLARLVVPGFTIGGYFTGYWIRVYPFLFATSSESLAMPLNLSLVRRYYAGLSAPAARFIISGGSTLDVNGTVICAVVLTAFGARFAGVPVSLADLAMAAPAIFIVSLAVPGIPGELALFFEPIAAAIAVPPAALAGFRTVFLGLQVGLPDAIRTGNNSTDDCVNALIFGRMLAANTSRTPDVS